MKRQRGKRAIHGRHWHQRRACRRGALAQRRGKVLQLERLVLLALKRVVPVPRNVDLFFYFIFNINFFNYFDTCDAQTLVSASGSLRTTSVRRSTSDVTLWNASATSRCAAAHGGWCFFCGV